MRKYLILSLSALVLLSLLSIPVFAADEKITITTFYPSPYGTYKELATDGMKVGVTYSGVGVTPPTSGLIVEGNVGIGTSDPHAKLIVSGGDTVSNVRVGIGTENPEAILDVSSITSAFLPPRMTEEQRTAISPKVRGMVVYNTISNKLEIWDGSDWVATSGGAVARFSLGSNSCGGGYCAGTYIYDAVGTGKYLSEQGLVIRTIEKDFSTDYFDKICKENGYDYFINARDTLLQALPNKVCKYWNGANWVTPPAPGGCILDIGDQFFNESVFVYLSSITCGK